MLVAMICQVNTLRQLRPKPDLVTSNRNSLLGVEAGLLWALTKVERVSLAGVSLSSEQASSLLVRINVMIKMLNRF